MRAVSIATIVVAALVGVGCADDLRPVTKKWLNLQEEMATAVTNAQKANAGIELKLKALPRETEATGKELRRKFDVAFAAQQKHAADLEVLAAETTPAVDAALATRKAKKVRAVLDEAKAKLDGAMASLPASATATAGAFDALKQQLITVKEQADAAVRIIAAQESADARVLRDGGPASFAIVFSKGEVDEQLSEGAAQRLVNFAFSCPMLRLELTVAGPDPKAAKIDADGAKAYLLGKGVPVERVTKAIGIQGDRVLTATVVKPCVELPNPD